MKDQTLPLHFSLVGEVITNYKRTQPVKELIQIGNSHDTARELRAIWNPNIEHFESFYALYLNRNNRILGYGLISMGGVAATVADIKIILQKAILSNASGLILSHNHPSGSTNPSQSDITFTKKIKDAALLMDVSLIDHVILTPDKYYSFADEGIL